jgi:hypothetical protein
MEGMTQEGFPEQQGEPVVHEAHDRLTGETFRLTDKVLYTPLDTSGQDPMEPATYGVGADVQGLILPSTPDTPPTE